MGRGGVHQGRGSLLHKPLMQQPFAVPYALVQVQPHQPQVILGGGEHAVAAQAGAGSIPIAHDVTGVHADFPEQPGIQVIQHGHAGSTLHQGRGNGRALGIVAPEGTGFMLEGACKEFFHPVFPISRALGFTAAGHGQDVPHRNACHPLRQGMRHFVRQQLADRIIQFQQAFVFRQAYSGGCPRFAEGMEGVVQLRGKGRPPAFGANLVMPHDHQPMHPCGAAILQLVQQAQDSFAGDAHFFRGAAFKFLSMAHTLPPSSSLFNSFS